MFTIRPPCPVIIERTTYFVRTSGDKVLMRMSDAISASRIVASTPLVPMPALLTSPKIGPHVVRICLTSSGSCAMQPRSNGTKRMEPPALDAGACIASVSDSLSRRATAMTSWPAAHSVFAIPSPSPRLPPVTMTLGIAASELARGSDVQRPDDAYRRRDLVRRERAAASREDLGLRVLDAYGVESLLIIREHHLGGNDGPGDRILPRRHERHAHAGVAIDHRLDFFGMDLEAADIDNPATSAGEVIAVTATLDDIAGVDESLGVEQCLTRIAEVAKGCAGRTDAQSVSVDPEVDVTTVTRDKGRRETGLTVRDLEGDARLGRRECVRDRRPRKRGLEMIDNRLVRDLSR